MKLLILNALILTGLISGCGNPAVTRESNTPGQETFICDTGERGSPGIPNKFPANPRFLVAGQSNSVSTAQQHPDYFSQTGLPLMNDPDHDNDPTVAPLTLRVPTAIEPFHSSIAWIYMADFLSAPMTIVNVGQGNTTTRKWRQYLHKRILTELAQHHYDAILWVQGESDIGEKVPFDETCSNLKFIIKESRKIDPNISWYIALDSAGNQPDNNSVRSAERAVVAQGWALQGPDTDSLRTNPNFVETGLGEFVGDGLREHGRMWYDVLKGRF